MRHTVYLSVALAAIWLLNSGHYTPLILGLCVLSIVFVVWLAHKMELVDNEGQPITATVRVPFYCFWLLKEIVLSNIDVVKRIWFSPHSISPTVATLKITQKEDTARVIYANSITLTPGTVTLDLQDDEVTVHALTEAALNELAKGEMDRRVSQLEK